MDRAVDGLSRFGQLIGLIYEGATDPSRWMTSILPAMADYLQVPQAYLFTTLHTPQDGGYFFHHGISQHFIDRYTSRHQHEDVWAAAAIRKNLVFDGNVFLGDDLIPRQQWLASKAYNEVFERDQDMVQMMAGIVFAPDSAVSMPVHCSFFRGLRHPEFGEEDRGRLRLLLPHLSRSLGVMQRLRSAELTVATSLAALDRLATGVLLLDAGGTVEYANRAAQRILEADDGLGLRKSGQSRGLGTLVAQNETSNRALQDAMRPPLGPDLYATRHFSSTITVPCAGGVSSYTLQFSALGEHAEFGGASQRLASIIFISDSRQRIDIDPQALERAYGLTPAEARVAIALVEFAAAKEVATALGVSPHTVRTQIRQIYAKLGVDTRTRFVKLMLGLSPPGA